MSGLLSIWRDWSERRQILRDLRRQRGDDGERLRFKVKDELTYALAGLARGDRLYAVKVWEGLLEKFPNDAKNSRLALTLLIGLKRFDEAETIMRTGRKKHSADPYFAKGLVEIAYAKRDFDSVLERCAFLRKRFPGTVEGYTLGADAFLAKDQLQAAETLAFEAIKLFPENIGGPLAYARLAVKEKRWEEALRRWQLIRDGFRFAGAYIGCAEALCHLGRYEEADQLLKQGRLSFGMEAGLHYEFARVAERKGDTAEAVQRWTTVLTRFPLDMSVYIAVSEAFERLDQSTEAEATLRTAVDRFPGELRPLLEVAKLLHFKRRNFPAAAEAWSQVRNDFPDNEEAYNTGADALRRAGHNKEAEAVKQECEIRFKKP